MSVKEQIILKIRYSRNRCHFCKRVCTYNYACTSEGQIIHMDEEGVCFNSLSCPRIIMLSNVGLRAH